ncbi:UNVERIFIED_CONTAM: hypothetical protein Sradi_4165300 [Sesamum radiatum]|uniref:Uncharacterized protein n=1 Tax=Sesamum radiatum TaxID=300843 RepID=A0AAW2P3R7_SESRA
MTDCFFPNHTTRVSSKVSIPLKVHISCKGKGSPFDFSDNSLVGEIPSNVTKLTGLVSFNISNNNLVGPIPPHIGEMKSLNSLDFSRNHLSGGIPTGICDLDSLGSLHLSYNNLSGRIPQDNHCLTFERPTYIGNVGLCGQQLNKSCPGDEPIQDPNSTVDAQGEFHDDDDDRFITRGFYIALALGFIVGFWGIYGTILLNKTFKYAVFNKFNVIGDFVCLRIELSKAGFWRFFQTRLTLKQYLFSVGGPPSTTIFSTGAACIANNPSSAHNAKPADRHTATTAKRASADQSISAETHIAAIANVHARYPKRGPASIASLFIAHHAIYSDYPDHNAFFPFPLTASFKLVLHMRCQDTIPLSIFNH